MKDLGKLNSRGNGVPTDRKPRLAAAAKERTIKVQKIALLRESLHKFTKLVQYRVQTQTPKKLRQVKCKQAKNKLSKQVH